MHLHRKEPEYRDWAGRGGRTSRGRSRRSASPPFGARRCPTRHHLRGLHPALERARRSAHPPGRGPPADSCLGPARSGQIDDRPAGRGGLQPPLRRHPRALSRPRRSTRNSVARRHRPHPLVVRRPSCRQRTTRAGGSSISRSCPPRCQWSRPPSINSSSTARSGSTSSRGCLDHRLRQPRDRPRRRPPMGGDDGEEGHRQRPAPLASEGGAAKVSRNSFSSRRSRSRWAATASNSPAMLNKAR